MLSLCLAAVVGCEDAPARQSERRIMEGIAQARRLCDRAQSMLDEVLFFVDGSPAPLYKVQPGKIDVQFDRNRMDELNPQALEALAQAQKALKGVLGESEAGTELAQALAKDALARVRSLQGQAAAYQAGLVRRKAAGIAAEIDRMLPTASAQADTLEYVEDMVARNSGDADDSMKGGIAKLIAAVKTDIGQLNMELNAQRGVVAERTTARDALLKQGSALRQQVNDLEQKSSLVRGDAKIKLIQEIEAKQIELDKTVRMTGQAETAVAEANKAITRIQAVLAAATARLTALESLEADRKKAAGVQAAAGTSASERIAETRKKIGDELVALATTWTELVALERTAQGCYDDAAGQLGKARRTLSAVGGDEFGGGGRAGGASPAAAAAGTRTEMIVGLAVSQGRAHVSSAELDIVSLLQHGTNVRLATSVEKLMPRLLKGGAAAPKEVTDALTAIRALVPLSGAAAGAEAPTGPAARTAAAAEKYKKAEKAFRDAVKEQRPALKWMDRGLLASALYMYGVCARDSTSIKDAQDQILRAMDKKAESPYVAESLGSVKRMLTFGTDAFVTVTDVGAGGEMLLEQGADKGTFFKTFGDAGRTGKDMPGAVYVVGRNIERGGVEYAEGTILLRVMGEQYIQAPAGLVLTIPADMTILGQSYKAGDEVIVPSDSKMAGAGTE